MTHVDLCDIACRWLACSDSKHLAALLRETHFFLKGEQPDAFAIWAPRGESHLVECKASRIDFAADRKKPWRIDPAKGIGAMRSYLTLPGVVRSADEIPEGWNWYEVVDEDTIAARLVCDPFGAPRHNFEERNYEGEWSLYWLYQRSRWWKKALRSYEKPVRVKWPGGEDD